MDTRQTRITRGIALAAILALFLFASHLEFQWAVEAGQVEAPR